jgi:hypothetical protein
MSRSTSNIRIKTRNSSQGQKSQIENTSDLIKFNRSKIENLKKSNNVLKEEIFREQRFADTNAKQAEQQILRLQKEGIEISKKIEVEARKREFLDQQIRECHEVISEKRTLIQSTEGEKTSKMA